MASDNRYGINLGAIYRDAEAIKGQRNTNQMNSMKIEEARRIEAERPMLEQQQRQKQKAIQGLRQQVVGGDDEARARYIAIDPEGAEQLIKVMAGEDDRVKESARANMDEMMKMSAYVMQAKNDPDQMEERYQQVMGSLPEEVRSTMPPNADMGFLADNMRKAMGASDYIKSLAPKEKEDIKQLNHGGKSLLQQDGEIIGSTAIPEKAAGAAGATNPLDDLKRQELEGKILERKQKIEKTANDLDHSDSQMASNLTSLKEFSTDVSSLLDNDDMIDTLAGKTGYLPDWVIKDSAVLFDKITNTNTLDNMGRMTGVLTDADMKVLRTAANGLERGMSVKRFKNRLQTIKNKIEAGIKTASKRNDLYQARMKKRDASRPGATTATQPVVNTAKWGQR